MVEREYLKQFEKDRLSVAFCEACGTEKDSSPKNATRVLIINLDKTTIVAQVCTECLSELQKTKPKDQEYIILDK